jgi:hypothetical protein
MSSRCDVKKCNVFNEDTTHYTVDWGDVRYYCEEHWDLINLFFSKVGAHSCNGCTRNHHAETDTSYRGVSTVKCHGKYWELCKMHLKIYEDCIDYFNNLELPED